ncbi:trigger factor [Sulfurimonas sp. HSL-3221]|uniref:trigger factor n=1 Tax=Thiomicrolovo sulfuroxydans TaxID=2894755 RepID=UPI001E2C0555|nr:trigger factor [Sulfurimonas sp. HSL-3221]UFS62758.1 trigger factor [Sulfurimonas sp. HSL-3221]
MEMSTNKINAANAEISATVTAGDLDKHFDNMAKELSKQANIPGFRKGKVPVSAVKKQYGERLMQDAESQAVREALNIGLDALKIAADALIGEPQFSKFDKKEDGTIEMTIKVAMRPEFDLGDYQAKVPDFKAPKITAKAVTDRIQEIAKAQAPFVDIEEDRAVEDGDTAVIDFEGFVDGEAFEGGKAEEFPLNIGSGQFIPGFEDQVIGMKAGDEKMIDVTFPESYGSEKLAGKPAQFKVKLHKIQTKEKVRMDAKLAKQLLPGEEDATIDMVKEQVQKQLENEERGKLFNEKLKPELLEAFVAAYNFDLPEFVVEQEMDMALNNKAREMSEEELAALRDDQEKVKELRETFRDDATRSVKATFIVDALARAEGVNVNEQEVMQTIYFEAMQTGQDPQATYDHYRESGYLPAIQMAMVEDKVLSGLLNAKMATAEE